MVAKEMVGMFSSSWIVVVVAADDYSNSMQESFGPRARVEVAFVGCFGSCFW